MAAAFVLLLALVLGGTMTETAVSAEKITLPWCKPAVPGNYTTRSMKEGDTVVFEWFGEYHTVLYYPSSDCFDTADKVFLGESGPVSYTFTAEDVGTSKAFVCDVSNHCQVGQYVIFDVVGADEEIEYALDTPCGDGYIGEKVVAAASSDDESGGEPGVVGGSGVVLAAALWIAAGLLFA